MKEQEHDLESLCRSLKPQGAASIELYFEKSSETSFSCLDGKISTSESSDLSGFGVRVIDKEGRVGFSYCQQKNELETASKRAYKMCRFSAPCKGFDFPALQKYQKKPASVSKGFKEIEGLGLHDAKSLFEKFIEASQSGGCSALEGSFSTSLSGFEIANSNGVYAEGCDATLSGWMQSKFKEYSSTAAAASWKLSGFEKDLVREGEKSARLARQSDGAKKIPTASCDVIFELSALASLIGGILLPSFDGERVRRGVSKLAAQAGKKMFSEKLSLCDDPTSTAGFYNSFDGEGNAASKKSLIENGVVQNFLYDSRTAALCGLGNKNLLGNCHRDSFQGSPSISSSNIVIGAGSSKKLEQEASKDYLVLHSFHGTHTANVTTGDFSVIADLAFLCAKSGEQKPVRGIIISGNVFDMLSKIKAVEKTQGKLINLITPRILFGSVTIVGS